MLDDPDVGDLTVGNFQEQIGLVGLNGTQSVAIWGMESLKGGPIDLTMLEGRWPDADDEIAVGLQTARALGVSVGDHVEAALRRHDQGPHRRRHPGSCRISALDRVWVRASACTMEVPS